MWLTDLSIVLPDRIANGSILVEDGLISQIVERTVPGGISAPGHQVFPGFVDMHGDMIEFEIEPRTQVAFPIEVAVAHLDARLAATGVTTAYAGVSFSRGSREGGLRSFEHTNRIIRALRDVQSGCRVDHRIHARFDITFDNAVGVLADLLRDGMVDLVSVMDHTPGQGQYRNIERLIELRAEHHGISLAEARKMVEDRIAENARPQDALLTNLRTVSEMCAAHGITLASHDDDTPGKAHLMADLGCTISEFPVTMEAAKITAGRGLMNAMGAPNAMRGKSYSGNLSARDAHAAGILHILAADYHPAAILPAIRALAETDPNGLAGATQLASLNPAAALGLSDRGQIAIGKRADLLIVDPKDRVAMTLVAGQLAYSNGTLQSARQGLTAVA